MKKLFKSQKGSMLAIFGLSAVVLVGFMALVADIGMMTLHKAKLSNAVDAAALAGAQELIYDEDNASARATQYFKENGYTDDLIDVVVDEDHTAIRVTASHEVKFGFAKVLGFTSENVQATVKGKVLPVIALNRGMRPFAIEDQELEFGSQYILKEGAGDGSGGNYGGIGLGGNGAQVYFNNIVEGYNERLMVGDNVETEPGNMSGPTENGINQLINQCTHVPRCTFEHFEPECPRVITVIIVDTLDINGRSTVQIEGFASFFLEGVEGSGNESEVTGRFIKSVASGEVSETQNDYGLYGVRLMQ